MGRGGGGMLTRALKNISYSYNIEESNEEENIPETRETSFQLFMGVFISPVSPANSFDLGCYFLL